MQTKCEMVLNKFIAIVLIMMMTLADIIAIGIDFATYAIDMVATSSSNVEFEAYFKDPSGEKITVTETELQAESLNVYVDISVKQEGYFNGKVMLENSNFSITKVTQNSYVNSFDENSVTLNQINSGKTATIEMQVKPKTSSTMNADILNKDTQVKLQGTYVSSKGNMDTEGIAVVTAKFVSAENIQSTLDAQIITNKVYQIDGTNKRMVQILVKSKIEGNKYPLKKDTLSLNLPSEAESVEVTARTTKATNPNVIFGNSNYSLNNEKNKLEINVENQPDQNGNISFEQNAKDEFVVTCIYAEDKTFENIDLSENNDETQSETELQNQIGNQIGNQLIAQSTTDEEQKAPIEILQEILTYDEKTLTQNKKLNIENQIDGILNYELSEHETNIYKGKIYSGEERIYNTNIRTYINSTKVPNNIAFTLEKTNYISGETKNESKITYKEITIKKEEIAKVLGEEGFITIKGEDNTIISNITKETQENSNGYIVINIPENTYKIQIETSNIENVGKIDFKVQKSIKENEYTREQIKLFTAIEDKIIAKEEAITKQIELKETTTKAKFDLSTTTLKSGKNDNVQMRITLLTDDESKDLYKNPTIKITFPEEATEVSATYKMLYANGLEKDSASLKEENGKKVLEIKLAGEQQSYPGDVIDGTEILVNASVVMNQLMTTAKDRIVLNYTNENATNVENGGVVEQGIDAMQTQSFIVTNDIEELGAKTIGKEEEKQIDLKATGETKTATVKIGVINNEGETLENVKILGRFPTKGQTNTMDITLTGGINISSNTEGVNVYYSIKEDASDDLNNSNNGWSTDVNLANKRSYLIVVASMENAEKVEAKYGIRINQDVKESKVASESFEVIYSRANIKGIKAESTDITLNIRDGRNLEMKLIASIGGNILNDGDEVHQGEVINYAISLTNKGVDDIENITVTGLVPGGTELYKEKDTNRALNKIFEGIVIKVGETKYLNYEVKINKDLKQGEIIENTIFTNYNDDVVKMNNIIKNVGIVVDMKRYKVNEENNALLRRGGEYEYDIVVKNNTNLKKEQLELNIKCDKDVNIINKKLTINNLEPNEERNFVIFVKLKEEAIYEKNINLYAEITEGNTKFQSNVIEEEVETSNAIVNLEAVSAIVDKNEKLKQGDDITFKLNIENTGSYNIDNLKIKFLLSNYLIIKECKYNQIDAVIFYEPSDIENYNIIKIEKGLNSNSKAEILIKCEINLTNNIDEISIKSKAQLFDESIFISESNEEVINIHSYKNNDNENISKRSSIVEKFNTIDDINEQGNKQDSKIGKYKITGKVWMEMQENEKKSFNDGNITVFLIDCITGKVALDENNAEIKTIINEEGEYTLKNIVKGKYIVAFKYDTEKYEISEYQKDGVDSSQNSYAILRNIVINGKEENLAATDIIIVDKDTEEVNLGIIERKKANIKLSQTISKITSICNDKQKEYNLEKINLSKIYIPENELNDTSVIIEYKIEVTNVGNTIGYIKNIVDYLPVGMEFEEALNEDWYKQGEHLYNRKLEETQLDVGKIEIVKLVLKKAMNKYNVGLITNKAEIIELDNYYSENLCKKTQDSNHLLEEKCGRADVIIEVENYKNFLHRIVMNSIYRISTTI